MAKPEVAVLGGDGFLGSHVGRHLLASGFAARGSFQGDEPGWQVSDLDWSWHRVKIGRGGELRRFVEGATAVIHCGGYEPRRALEVDRAKRSGVEQTRAVADACRGAGVRRVVYVSSISTALGGREEVIDETSRYVPGTVKNGYFEAKAAMENEWYRYVACGMDVVIAMPTTIFGPGDFNSGATRLLTRIAGRGLCLAPRGGRLNVVDVRDVAAGLVAALRRGRSGRRYILGGENIELSRFTQMILGEVGRRVPRRAVGVRRLRALAKVGEMLIERIGWRDAPPVLVATELALRSREISNDRARGELQFRPRKAQQTVEDTVRWLVRTGYLSWLASADAAALDHNGVFC